MRPRGTVGLVGGGAHIESDTEKQGRSRSEGLVSDFGLGTTVQLNGHWQVV